MEVQELKIGNYVGYNGIITIVDGIQSPKPMKDKRYSNKFIIDLFEGAGLITSTIDQLTPIELTEQWLIDFGFKYLGPLFDCELYKSDIVTVSKIKDIYTFSLKRDAKSVYTPLVEITTVHQLQNMYYSLVGKELTKQ